MLQWLIEALRTYPELAIFLTLALGYWLGGLKIGSFALGAVTGTLLVGVVVGQLDIVISPHVKSVFFHVSVRRSASGPAVRPRPQERWVPAGDFAVLQCVASLLTIFLVAKGTRHERRVGRQLMAGSQTISAVLGVAGDAINRLGSRRKRRSSLSMPCRLPTQ